MSGIRTEGGAIVIDDARVCGFASRPGVLDTYITVLRAVCDALETDRREEGRSADRREEGRSADRGEEGRCSDRGEEGRCADRREEEGRMCSALADEICARVTAAQRAASEVSGGLGGAPALAGVLARIVDERVSMSASVQRLADSNAASRDEVRRDVEACISRSTEEIHARVQRHGADVTGALARLTEERDATRKTLERVCALLDDRAAASNRRKGDEGEVTLVEVLEGTMTLRDGFTIHRVGTIPHNCDILVRKSGKPDVRIECKAHGKDNGKPVATREVVRFEDDLKGLRNHGIFVSLYAPITGKAAFELRLLESNRVAVYLSNNHFDAAMIRDLVLLIYSVDELINADGVVLSPEQIGHIRSGLDDLSAKAAQIQTHLRASLELLSSMCFSSVARMLTAVQAEPLVVETVATAATAATVEAAGTVGTTVARVRRPYKKRGT